jgi:hypothetical protein
LAPLPILTHHFLTKEQEQRRSMAQPVFNPASEVQFDLGRGQISLSGRTPRVLVPADALAALCRSAGAEAIRDFGRQLGTEVGRRVSERLGNVTKADVASVVEHLGGDLALGGFGSLSVERWGRALVLRIAGCPLGAEGDVLVAAVFEGALQRGLGRDTNVVPIERSDSSVRLLATSSAAARKVRDWIAAGVSWGDALARLNGG